MLNAVGREIPEEVIKATGKQPFKGAYAFDNYEYTKAAPKVRTCCDPTRSKIVENIHEALVKCEIKDNMTVSFHHHFREGDYIVNMVMEEIHNMGIKGITICASSLGKANDPIVPYIEDGTIVGIQSSGVRGKIGEAISNGKLRDLAIMRSHGGRVRAIETNEVHIDIAFIGAPTCDEYGNMKANGGKSDCGVLSYAYADAQYADKVVAITDCLVPFPNLPASISMVNVDYVCVVDAIGNPAKIATGAAKPTTDVRKLMMADYCTQFVINTPYFKDGFSYQTGVGGASIASTISLGKIMEERGITMGLGLGGITTPMCQLLEKGLVKTLVDTQDFDMGAIESTKKNPNHIEITASEYCPIPSTKGAYCQQA
jgi:Citrate lyase, alpha subunit